MRLRSAAVKGRTFLLSMMFMADLLRRNIGDALRFTQGSDQIARIRLGRSPRSPPASFANSFRASLTEPAACIARPAARRTGRGAENVRANPSIAAAVAMTSARRQAV